MKYQVAAIFTRIRPDVEVERRTKQEAYAQAALRSKTTGPWWDADSPRRIEVRRRESARRIGGAERYMPIRVGVRKHGAWKWRDLAADNA